METNKNSKKLLNKRLPISEWPEDKLENLLRDIELADFEYDNKLAKSIDTL